MGRIFNIQRFSLHDGPGVRTVIFLKGCPLNCLWCHNPESKRPGAQLMVDPGRCIGCGECAVRCPDGLHRMTPEGIHQFDRAHCVACGQCARSCPAEAISLVGEERDAASVMEEALRDSRFFASSGGGITLSGGEPLSQPEFAAGLLRLAHDSGVNTCVETSGYAGEAALKRVAEETDLFLFDIKALDEFTHRRATGGDLAVVLNSLSLLEAWGKPVVLRCPIIPGINDTLEHADAVAALAERHECVRSVELEPYHAMGVDKSRRLGEKNLYETEEDARAAAQRLCERMRERLALPVSVS